MTSIKDQINCYPSFQPNQVLTSFHLNRLSDYLAQQERLALQKLTGVGIACGLEVGKVTFQEKAVVFITKGSGITSEGYLMALDPESCFPKESDCLERETVKDANGAESSNWEEPCFYTHYRPFLYKGGYSPFDNAFKHLNLKKTEHNIIELVQDPGDGGDDDINPLRPNQLEDSVVLLYLEIVEENIDKCQEEGCNEKGKRIQHTLRKLVVRHNIMDAIINKLPDNTASYSPPGEAYPAYGLPDVFIKRFGYNPYSNPLKLESITTLDGFVTFYFQAVKNGWTQLKTAFDELYKKYRPLVDMQLGSITGNFSVGRELHSTGNPFKHFSKFEASTIKESPLILQYFYDFLRDLTDTYNELTGLLYDLVARCCPNPGLFPRHLMLGNLTTMNPTTMEKSHYNPASAYPPEKYRHHFIPSPIYNGQSDLLRNVKQLIQRLDLQCKYFDLEHIKQVMKEKSVIKILPSEGCASPLGHRPMPFYYKHREDLVKFWNYELGVQARTKRVTGYHLDAGQTLGLYKTITLNPLLNDICEFPKLRIEGHVGQTLKSAQEQLEAERENYNLPFDILALKLDANFDNGVYLVEEKIIADLQIHYRLLRTDLVCTVPPLLDFFGRAVGEDVADVFNEIAEEMSLSQSQMRESYIKDLENLVELLPGDIKKFNINSFKVRYRNLADRLNSVKTKLYTLSRSYLPYYIEKISDNYIQSQLETLYTVFLERVETFSLFSTFNKTIHGMEHIAGTTKGGTFILVYYDAGKEHKTSASDKATQKYLMAAQDEGAEVIIPQTPHPGIDFNENDNYIVVADFHLPCPISSLIEPRLLNLIQNIR